MSLVPLRLGQVLEQLLHKVTELLLEVIQDGRIVVVYDVLLDELALRLLLVFTLLHLGENLLVWIGSFLLLIVVHLLVRITFTSLEYIVVFDVIEEPDDDP